MIIRNTKSVFCQLASSGPYGPLLARSGYPGQDASFYNNQMVMICATVNAPTLLETILCQFGRICATRNALVQLKMILCELGLDGSVRLEMLLCS